MTTTSFPMLLQHFFTHRLAGQLGASAHTIAAYRDTFHLLLQFASQCLGQAPCRLRLEDLNAVFLEQFLDHLQRDRGNTVTTRNTRLAALRAFFRYVSFTDPSHALDCQRVLAIPSKRHDRKPVAFLVDAEVWPSPPHLTAAAGSAGETMPCCSWRRKPACATAKSAPFDAKTSSSVPAHMSAAPARGGRHAARPCVLTSPRPWRLGCPNWRVRRIAPSSPAPEVAL